MTSDDLGPAAEASAPRLATLVIEMLRARGEQVATAESLTGGGVSLALTAVPGASAVVAGGVVAYLPQIKERVLRVPRALIAAYGVVSPECAEAMARGARNLLETEWAVATTGVAGPEGSEGKRPGVVYIAVHGSGAGEQIGAVQALNLHGSREQIRAATVTSTLSLLADQLRLAESSVDGCPTPEGAGGYGGDHR